MNSEYDVPLIGPQSIVGERWDQTRRTRGFVEMWKKIKAGEMRGADVVTYSDSYLVRHDKVAKVDQDEEGGSTRLILPQQMGSKHSEAPELGSRDQGD